MVPLVRTFVSYPAGISRMSMPRFLLFSTLGSLPWNLGLIAAGYVVGDNYEQIEAALKPYEYVIYAVVIGVVVIGVARWWWAKRRRSPSGA
jgi:membrane protein DedA with SNARE-associated domain